MMVNFFDVVILYTLYGQKSICGVFVFVYFVCILCGVFVDKTMPDLICFKYSMLSPLRSCYFHR